MQLGYELIREQLFFRKELIERLPWLIRLRWIAAGVGLAGCAAFYLFRQTLPPLPLALVFVVVLLYNLLFKFIWQYVPPFNIKMIFRQPIHMFIIRGTFNRSVFLPMSRSRPIFWPFFRQYTIQEVFTALLCNFSYSISY